MVVNAGHRRQNGITHVCFSSDSSYTVTAGGDGTLSCWGWNLSNLGRNRVAAAASAAKTRLDQLRSIRQDQDAFLTRMPELDLNRLSGL